MATRETLGRIGQFAGDAIIGLVMFYLLLGCLTADGGARAAQRSATDAAAYAAVDATAIAQGVAASVAAPSASGPALTLAGPPTAAVSLLRPTSEGKAMIVLALVFSLLVSLNLGFWRHLRRAYAGRH